MAPPTTGTAIGASTDTRTDSPGRTRILEVAAGRFLDHDYEAASLRRIAEDVGIQTASIYHHFDSEEDLLATILRRSMAVMDDAFDRAAGRVDDHDADPRDPPGRPARGRPLHRRARDDLPHRPRRGPGRHRPRQRRLQGPVDRPAPFPGRRRPPGSRHRRRGGPRPPPRRHERHRRQVRPGFRIAGPPDRCGRPPVLGWARPGRRLRAGNPHMTNRNAYATEVMLEKVAKRSF
ncbi:MAG: hypothetical protein CL466_12740 [Acidimicrobiaceae bacterium]|nr:hypothetical protein [Acidimicrobiaceae bacterium]